jgi:hypothetical protein
VFFFSESTASRRPITLFGLASLCLRISHQSSGNPGNPEEPKEKPTYPDIDDRKYVGHTDDGYHVSRAILCLMRPISDAARMPSPHCQELKKTENQQVHKS